LGKKRWFLNKRSRPANVRNSEGLNGFLSKNYQGFFIFFCFKTGNKKWLLFAAINKLKFHVIAGQRFTI